ncbi:hypothetical protein ACVIIW_004911 [Bradyrhizobium sp. USDA 4449]
MARKLRHATLENRSNRLKLAVRFKPYAGVKLARGASLLCRRNKGNGTWVVKVSDGSSRYWTKGFAASDDFDAADGKTILDFYQAQDVAKTWRASSPKSSAARTAGPRPWPKRSTLMKAISR